MILKIKKYPFKYLTNFKLFINQHRRSKYFDKPVPLNQILWTNFLSFLLSTEGILNILHKTRYVH